MEEKLSQQELLTVAFYNLENLFDVHDAHGKNDKDFLPDSNKRWTLKRYKNKVKKLGFAISNIGVKETNTHPILVGLAEVENEKTLKDLIQSKNLESLPYNFVHYDSPDERGIDVALLYDKNRFAVLDSKNHFIQLHDDRGDVDYTRDILHVTGLLDGYKVHVIVNHWPSRRQGNIETEHKRLTAANKVIDIITAIKTEDENAKIIIMGDFNDDPASKSIKHLVKSKGLYNPMDTLLSYTRGTTSHNKKWNLFDQIIITTNFFERKPEVLRFYDADIFDADFLKQFEGRYKGTPFRTFVGKKYKGGYSDHFPVYITLKKNKGIKPLEG